MFDYPRRQDGPQIGTIILHLLGFGIVTFICIDYDETQLGMWQYK
jgi:hypothetical protein